MNHYKYSILHLSTGETIVAEVKTHDVEAQEITVKNPVKILFDEDIDVKSLQLYAYPYIPLLEEGKAVAISTNHIVSSAKCGEDMYDYYETAMEFLFEEDGKNKTVDAVELEDIKDAVELKKELSKQLTMLANTSIH